MSGIQIAGVALLIAGVLAFVFKGFTYTTEEHSADVGPIEMRVEEERRLDLPVWVGAVLVMAGGGLLLAGSRR